MTTQWHDDELTGRWAGLPCVIYVRISAADIRALRRARRAMTAAEKAAALAEKVTMHLDECRAFAADAGLVIVDGGEFVERNVSASALRGAGKRLPRREDLMAWLAARTGTVVVLTTEVERLFRDVGESLSMVKEADRLGALGEAGARRGRLYVLDTAGQEYDLTTANGRHNWHEAVSVAEREAGKVSERRRRRERKRAADGHYWGRRPFGYEKVYDGGDGERVYTGLLAVRESEAACVRAGAAAVLAARDAGRQPSLRAIAVAWNDAGAVTAEGNPWTGSKVRKTLTSPLYAGLRVHRPGSLAGRAPRNGPGHVTPGAWPPVLDVATHERVVAAIADPARKTNGDAWTVRYELSGLARCGRCGRRMHTSPHPRQGRQLRCAPKPDGCGGVSRALEPVTDWVREVVLWWLREGGEYAAYRAAARDDAGEQAARARLGEVAAELARLDGELADWAEQMAAGFPKAAARATCERIEARQAALRAEQATATARLAAAVVTAPAGPRPDADGPDWAVMTAPERRDWLSRYVDRVVIHPAVRGRNRFDPSAVEVVPGAWWAGPRPPGRPPGPLPAPARPRRTCTLPRCPRPHDSGGLCQMHSRRARAAAARGTPDDWDRSPEPIPPGGRRRTANVRVRREPPA